MCYDIRKFKSFEERSTPFLWTVVVDENFEQIHYEILKNSPKL